jgi:RNA polymerase sigma-70 factor (ECF subfamily)
MTPDEHTPPEVRRFTALYREHHAQVRLFASRRVGADLAEEIVADTFLVAWRRIGAIPDAAVPWLYRVALYEIANLRRRQTKAIQLHFALQAGNPGDAGEQSPDGVTDLVHAVARAFDKLKPREQEILRLAAWEQLSAAEGAAVLRCSVSAYRMRLHRARASLADKARSRAIGQASRHDAPASASVLMRAIALGHHPIEETELLL